MPIHHSSIRASHIAGFPIDSQRESTGSSHLPPLLLSTIQDFCIAQFFKLHLHPTLHPKLPSEQLKKKSSEKTGEKGSLFPGLSHL